jgi:hypothetical protein
LEDLRNEVVHEGALYAPHHELLAQALDDAVFAVIGAVADAMLASGSASLADVERAVNAPWM